MLSTLASDHTAQLSPPVLTLDVHDANDDDRTHAVSAWPPRTRSPFASPLMDHSSPTHTLTPHEWPVVESRRAPRRATRTRFAASRSSTHLNKTRRRHRRVADLHVFMGLLMSVVGAGMLSVPYTFVDIPTAQAVVGVVGVGAAIACTATAFLYAHVEVVSADEKRQWRTRARTLGGNNIRSDRGGFGISGVGGVRVNGVDVRIGVDGDNGNDSVVGTGVGSDNDVGVAGSKLASFPALARRAGGDAFALVVTLVTACGVFGGCVGGLRVLRDLTPHIVGLVLRRSSSDATVSGSARKDDTDNLHEQDTVELVVLVGVFALVVLPLCLLKNLSVFKASSYVGFILSLYVVLAVMYRSLETGTAASDVPSSNVNESGLLSSSSDADGSNGVLDDIIQRGVRQLTSHKGADRDARPVASFVRFARAVSIYNFAFMMHLNLLPLFVQLRVGGCDKTTTSTTTAGVAYVGPTGRRIRPIRTARSRMAVAIATVAGMCILLDVSLGVCGAKVYGATIEGNLLLNLQHDRAMTVPLVVVYVTLLMTFPLLFHPLRRITEELVFKSGHASSRPVVAAGTRLATSEPSRVTRAVRETQARAGTVAVSFVEVHADGSTTASTTVVTVTTASSNEEEEATATASDTTSTDVSFARRLVVTLVLLGSALVVAIHVPSVEAVFSLVGATTCTLICFAIPVAIFTRVFPWRRSTAGMACTVVLWFIVASEAMLGLVVVWSLIV